MKHLVGLLLAVVLAAGAATLVTPHPSAATPILPDYSGLVTRGGLVTSGPGFFFRFALLILDANGQASANIHFVDERASGRALCGS